MSIAKVEALHHQLEELFLNSEDANFETKNLERIDTAVLQTLVSFVRAMSEAGCKVSWSELSEDFLASAELLGVKSALGLEAQ